MEEANWKAPAGRSRFEKSVAARVHCLAARLLSCAEGAEEADALSVMRAMSGGRVIARNQAMLMRTSTLASAYLARCAPQDGWYALGLVAESESGVLVIVAPEEVTLVHNGLGLVWRAGSGAALDGVGVRPGEVLIDRLCTSPHERGLRAEVRSGKAQRVTRALCEQFDAPGCARVVFPASPAKTQTWEVQPWG